jgi:hypothetical protein
LEPKRERLVNDPHVLALRYRIERLRDISYPEATEPEEYAFDTFTVTRTGYSATGTLLTHFATDDEAREHIEPILRAWERADAFTRGSPEFRFDYESVDVIDRAADPGATTKELRALVRATASVGVDLHVQRAAFPKPPDRPLALTPDAETLWNRWLGFLANREPLSSFAYFVHTVVCLNRSEREAASALGVAGNVIETLRTVSSYAGGRKGDALRPHTATEETWLKATVPILIRRVAEVAADPRAREQQITLADLPPL